MKINLHKVLVLECIFRNIVISETDLKCLFNQCIGEMDFIAQGNLKSLFLHYRVLSTKTVKTIGEHSNKNI